MGGLFWDNIQVINTSNFKTMKTISKFITGLFVAGSLVLGLTKPAYAQNGGANYTFFNRSPQFHPDALRVNTKSFYHPFMYPQIGKIVHALPAEPYSFVHNNYTYYFADGLYYQKYADGNYKLTAPPYGAEIRSLPFGAQIITIDGYPYYQYKGIYYDSVIHQDGEFGYKVVGRDGIAPVSVIDSSVPLVGDMIDELPDGGHQIRLNGKSYWVIPGEIYLEEVRDDKKPRYRVVWVPEHKKNDPLTKDAPQT